MSRHTLLVVEDNPITRKMMRFAFESASYDVLEAGDGETALRLASQRPPDLIVQDYVLPDMDGLQLIARLRALPGLAEIPILVVTGMVSQLEGLRAAAGPQTTVLPKPIEPSRLIDIVSTYLSAEARPSGKGRRVLVVDDETLNRKLAAIRLGDAGFEVDTAADGEEALAQARRRIPDAILSDVMMPGMDGFLLCKAVREDPKLMRVPVVLLSSAYVEEADRALARAMGAHALLLRSPDMQSAVTALIAALEPGAQPALAAKREDLVALHKERVQVQLEAQVARNETLLRQGAIQAAALSVVRGLASVLAKPQDLPSILGDVLVHCLDATGLSTGLLYMAGADGSLQLRAQAGLPADVREDAAACFHSDALRHVLDGGEPVACSAADTGQRPGLRELAERLGKPFVLLIPFVVADERIGLLVLAAESHNLCEPAWTAFARALAAQFGQTIAVGRSLQRGAASEARYRSLMEHANDAILLLEPGRLILEVNRQAEVLLGRPREELVGHQYVEFVVAEERPDAERRNEQLLGQRSDRVQNRHFQRPDGSRVAVDVSASLVRIGEETLALAILRDVTERNRAESELREHARLATFTAEVSAALVLDEPLPSILRRCCEAAVEHLEAAFARIWTLNEAEGMLELQASAGMYTHLDGPHGRVPVGRFKIGLIAAERRPHLTNSVIGDPRVNDQAWAEREGMVAFAGYPLIVGDRLVGVIAMFSRQTLSGAVPQALAGVADQIALAIERKRDLEALRRSEARMKSILDAALDAVVAMDDRGRVVSWNHRAEAIFGWPAGEAVGRTVADLIRKARLTLVNDVTERVSLAAQLNQAQRMESIGRLAGGVAHDFNNLLGVITGYGELLRRRLEEPRLRKYSEDILQASERAAGLTRQLLAFSRQQVLQPRILDVNAIVEELEKMLRRLIGEDVVLTTALAASPGLVRADRGQLEQVLMNLVVNARDAMPKGGRIRIETAALELDEAYARRHEGVAPGRHVMLAVSDTGSGMSPEVRARIFEPFFTTKGEGKGTGLGLATAYGIVKQSGGHIFVYSEPGQGSTFKVYLPRIEAAGVSEAGARSETRPLPGGTETILLVEDEVSLRELVRECLEGCGYAVIDARQGADALERAERHKGVIHLLITDVVMPGMGGRDLAKHLASRHPELRVLYMSGYTDDAVVHHGVLSEEMDFLQKPFSHDALARKVREVLDRPATPP